MATIKEVDESMSIALEMCEDWKPERQWESKEVSMIWFTNKQLREFIKKIKE